MDINEQITAELHGTTDAQVWAKRFYEIFYVSEPNATSYPYEGPAIASENDTIELMTTWFANAIEAGRHAGLQAKIEPATLRVWEGPRRPISQFNENHALCQIGWWREPQQDFVPITEKLEITGSASPVYVEVE